MNATQTLFKSSFDAGRAWLRPAAWWGYGAGTESAPPVAAAPPAAPGAALVPIRTLGPDARGLIAAHILALDGADRYARFGYAANDAQIQTYVAQLDFERDQVLGIYDRSLALIAVGHVALVANADHPGCAELGVSVLKSARGRGLGGCLLARASMLARNQGMPRLWIHTLSENTAMLKIARRAGAVVQRDGSESQACLALPHAGWDSRMAQLVEQQYAEVDYRIKLQAKGFSDVLGRWQTRRCSAVRPRAKAAVDA